MDIYILMMSFDVKRIISNNISLILSFNFCSKKVPKHQTQTPITNLMQQHQPIIKCCIFFQFTQRDMKSKLL